MIYLERPLSVEIHGGNDHGLISVNKYGECEYSVQNLLTYMGRQLVTYCFHCILVRHTKVLQ